MLLVLRPRFASLEVVDAASLEADKMRDFLLFEEVIRIGSIVRIVWDSFLLEVNRD